MVQLYKSLSHPTPLRFEVGLARAGCFLEVGGRGGRLLPLRREELAQGRELTALLAYGKPVIPTLLETRDHQFLKSPSIV